MKIEDQVCSLELSKKLKELGVKQDSIFYWINGVITDINVSPEQTRNLWYPAHSYTLYSAFTVAELGEMLPPSIE